MSTELATDPLDKLVEEIRALIPMAAMELAQACRHAAAFIEHGADIGGKLLECKALCKHGNWEDLVEIRLGLHPRAAQRYIKAWKDRRALPNDGPSPAFLQLAFDTVDFKPAASSQSDRQASCVRPSGVIKYISSGFWDYVETRETPWDEIEKTTYAEDLAKRLELAKRLGITLPTSTPIIDV
jgi:hypothetical protein